MNNPLHISLVGNPNSGKSSLFNVLTGMNQSVGNFPGVTVDKKTGTCQIAPNIKSVITDLPGTYSIYPRKQDEWVAYSVLMGHHPEIKPDIVILVADASNLKRNLLFCSQIIDLKIPLVVALTMTDLARKKKIQIDIPGLERELGVQIVPINPRKNKGIKELKKAVELLTSNLSHYAPRDFIETTSGNLAAIQQVRSILPGTSDYAAQLNLIYPEEQIHAPLIKQQIRQIAADNHFNATKTQAEEIMKRYNRINNIMHQTVVESDPLERSLLNEKIDKILLHRVWGYVILLGVLFLLFQSVFWISTYPMDAIEWSFGAFSGWLTDVLPQNAISDLFINGIVAGLSGILVFIPQIMILFGLITLLEDTGYMARISFLTDKVMRKVGLNGKSVMPMISAYACAVPAVMSARSIENKRERLLTIMVTPLMSCSARLPVYTILISLVIPQELLWGVVSLQGLVMMGLYLLGTVMALIVAWVMKWFIHSNEKSYFILELPMYREPRWNTILMTMYQKAKIFVTEAGKIIMIISILLWAMSSYGPSDKMHNVSLKYEKIIQENPELKEELAAQKQAELLENSYAGVLGKAIEPVIEPLGYDWKIGIALITSFAAREVFVGTMATLYSVGGEADENSLTLREKMQAAVKPDGTKVYTMATGLSLMVFYVLAMQCMSTIAIVKRETRSWKWALIQVGYMTVLAYVMSLIVYQLFK